MRVSFEDDCCMSDAHVHLTATNIHTGLFEFQYQFSQFLHSSNLIASVKDLFIGATTPLCVMWLPLDLCYQMVW